MSKFYKLSDDTIQTFKKVFNRKSFPFNIGFEFVGSESQKNLIKITKLQDPIAFTLEKEMLVSMNEDLINVFDEESIQILIEQEIDKISMNRYEFACNTLKTITSFIVSIYFFK